MGEATHRYRYSMSGNQSLFDAVTRGSPQEVERLLSEGAKVNERTYKVFSNLFPHLTSFPLSMATLLSTSHASWDSLRLQPCCSITKLLSMSKIMSSLVLPSTEIHRKTTLLSPRLASKECLKSSLCLSRGEPIPP
jgi:hypothetical protein